MKVWWVLWSICWIPLAHAESPDIDSLINTAIADGNMPGCVVVIGNHLQVTFARAYGSRSVKPDVEPMTLDTVFDIASLTKPLVTSLAVMQLAQAGTVDLDRELTRYVPELRRQQSFTLQDLLLHTSGLPPTLTPRWFSHGRKALIRKLGTLKPRAKTGDNFIYSDLNFILLEEVISRVTHATLDVYAAREIFAPLGMTDTRFNPPETWRTRIAPTSPYRGSWKRGVVHDPGAYLLGGVGGHAGVFSTGPDLARFARMLLNHGSLDGVQVLSEAWLERWTTPQPTPRGRRTLGWDVDSPFAIQRGLGWSERAFGHGGFTGVSLWVDPEKDVFFVFLSSRLHPDGKGMVNPLIAELATRIAGGQ